MSKRNITYTKPEDPEFLRVLKKQVGYDARNPKFDKLQNSAEDFADDNDTEQPQVVVLNPGDLTAEEADAEKIRIEKETLEAKADLSKRVFFKKNKNDNDISKNSKRTNKEKDESKKRQKKSLLSFDVDEDC